MVIKQRNHVDEGKGHGEMIASAKGIESVDIEEEGYYDYLQDKAAMPCVV